jgi:hypothetical protein
MSPLELDLSGLKVLRISFSFPELPIGTECRVLMIRVSDLCSGGSSYGTSPGDWLF